MRERTAMSKLSKDIAELQRYQGMVHFGTLPMEEQHKNRRRLETLKAMLEEKKQVSNKQIAQIAESMFWPGILPTNFPRFDGQYAQLKGSMEEIHTTVHDFTDKLFAVSLQNITRKGISPPDQGQVPSAGRPLKRRRVEEEGEILSSDPVADNSEMDKAMANVTERMERVTVNVDELDSTFCTIL